MSARRRMAVLAAFFLLLFGMATPVKAIAVFQPFLNVNGAPVQLTTNVLDAFTTQFSYASGNLSVTGVFDQDPMITWDITITDNEQTGPWIFDFIMPIVGGPYTYAAAHLSGQVTPSATITPTGSSKVLTGTASNPTTNLGVDIGDAFTGLGAYGPFFAVSPISDPGFSTLIAHLEFTLDTGADLNLTGDLELVPEPATCMLIGAGLIGLAMLARRRSTV